MAEKAPHSSFDPRSDLTIDYALIATGQNTWYTHYHRDTAPLDASLLQTDIARSLGEGSARG